MVPTWVITAFVVVVGCILACVVGTQLPDYTAAYDYGIIYIVCALIVGTICVMTNNFPFLLALGTWMPFVLPLGSFRQFPPLVLVLGWVGTMVFLRLCMTGTISYVKSFNLYFLLVFSWVVIRFLMNPVNKLGASVAGASSGVSGAMPYFYYVFAAIVLLALGAVLITRESVVSFIRWCFLLVLIIGIGFTICAFIPATAPVMYSLGVFSAGNMGDGILRFVQLPAYGQFLLQAAICPYLFRLKPWQSIVLSGAGIFMVILGGNRGTILCCMVAIPVILLLRRRINLLAMVLAMGVLTILGVHFAIDSAHGSQISPLTRSLGVFDSKIDEASGGKESSEWRKEVWQSGLKKIMESPLIGKGYGNLPKHLDTGNGQTGDSLMENTDFEFILAGGEAHNGFISAAYGFGLPFMFALTAGILIRMLVHFQMAWRVDRHDRELVDLYAFLASMFPSYLINIGTAFDMNVTGLWIYIAIGFIMQNLSKRPQTDLASSAASHQGVSNSPYKLMPTRY